MNEKKPKKKRHLLRSAVLLALVVLLAFFGTSYALGWISFHQGDGTFTIEIQTGKAKQDTDQAVRQSKHAAAEAGKVLQSAGKELEALGNEKDQSAKPSSTDDRDPTPDRDADTTTQSPE